MLESNKQYRWNLGNDMPEGKWISGRFDRNIRIDHPTHGVWQTHAHVLGRRDEVLQL